MGRKRKKKKSKKYNPLKIVKKLARDMFIDIPTGEKVFKDKKKYNRKIKHKKRLDDE
tara:strand:- start:236 stop:406 length:171 start_codon:yes stop_codon:yes gene_type:complete